MKKILLQWKRFIVFVLLLFMGFMAGVFFGYVKFKDSAQGFTPENISDQTGKEKETNFKESKLHFQDYNQLQNVKGDTLKIILEEYKEAVGWIRTMWGLRITLISITLSAFGLILARFYKPILIFLPIPIIFFIDFACTYTTLPFIYSCIYIETFYFPNTHHIATNWNQWQSVPIHELLKIEDTKKIHDQFKQKYLIKIYKKKLVIYLFFSIALFLLYLLLKSKKGLINASNKFG